MFHVSLFCFLISNGSGASQFLPVLSTYCLYAPQSEMDAYESLSDDYSDGEIKHALSIMKKMKTRSPVNCSRCSCSDCAGDSDSSDASYSGDCSFSDSDCGGGSVCALAPKSKRGSRRTVRSGKNAQKRQQQSCRGGVCPLVRKPKKTPAKKVTKKPAKKSPRSKRSSCYCCYN